MQVRDTTHINPLKLPEVLLPDVKDETVNTTASDYLDQNSGHRDGADEVQVS